MVIEYKLSANKFIFKALYIITAYEININVYWIWQYSKARVGGTKVQPIVFHLILIG